MPSKKVKHVCSAYTCDGTATYLRVIDGHKFKFCEKHKYCLNHARAEIIIEMTRASVMTLEFILNRFNYKVCGFSRGVLSETIKILIEENHLSVIDGNITSYKDSETCLFPGCRFQKTTDDYCAGHADLLPYTTIMEMLDELIGPGRTSVELADLFDIDVNIVKSTLKKLAKTGHVIVAKVGIINHYSTP